MNWLKLLLSILSAAPQIIVGVETLLGKTQGETKKALVVSIAANTAAAAGATGPQILALSEMVSTVADATVASYNASGVFEKSAPQKP